MNEFKVHKSFKQKILDGYLAKQAVPENRVSKSLEAKIIIERTKSGITINIRTVSGVEIMEATVEPMHAGDTVIIDEVILADVILD